MSETGQPNLLGEIARSEHLPALIEMLAPALRQLGRFGVTLQLRVIVDTSTILADLRWQLRSRRNADARPALFEALTAQVVAAYAPKQIDREVEANLPHLSKQTGASPEAIWSMWLEYRRLLTLVEPATLGTPATTYLSGRDPSDIAFVQTSERVGAQAILSSDRDLLDADPRARKAQEIVVDLRAYARSKSAELTVYVMGMLSFRVSVQGIVAGIRLLPRLVDALARIPPWLQLVLAAAAIWVLANSDRRAAAKRVFENLRRWFGGLISEFISQVEAVLQAAAAAHVEAEAARSRVMSRVQPRKLLLRQAVVLACASRSQPVPLDDLERSVRELGYESPARVLAPHILRTLRKDQRFTETSGGWVLTDATTAQ